MRCCCRPPASFWDKKEPGDWTEAESEQFKTNSPWARKVPLDIKGMKVARMDGAGSRGSFGGMAGADGNGLSEGRGRGPIATSGPVGKAPDVIVRWESALPMVIATGWNAPDAFNDSYAISVTGLPAAVLVVNAVREPEDPAERLKASIERLLSGTTLSAKGNEPVKAAFVVQSKDKASLIFAFPKDKLRLSADEREAVFTLQLGAAKVQAKFEPKAMLYQGKSAL